MAQCVFQTAYISGTNQDKKRGGVVTGSFYHVSSMGALPPAGSKIQSVSVYFSNINIYTTVAAGFSTVYGSMSLALRDGAQTVSMTGISSSLVNFTGGDIAFTVTGGGSSSSGVLNVREGSYIEITINYVTSSASTGSLSSSSVYPGNEITLYINPASSDFSHKVRWYRGSGYANEYELAAGITETTITIPSSWPTGSATVTLYSYYDGGLVGSNAYSFTIAVNPSTIYPSPGTLAVSLVQSSYIPSGWGLFVKGYSRAKLVLSGATPGSGAAYKSIALACGSQSQSTASTTSFTTAELQETGIIACTAKVTNSSGNAASASAVNITVYDYHEPIFAVVSAFRCTADGTPSDSGAYFGVTANVNIASVNGKNSLISLQARYAVQGTTSWSTAAAITNGSTTIIGGGATSNSTYQVQVIAIDAVQNLRNTNSNATVTALTSEHVIYCMDGGLNVSFGMEGTRQNAVEINPSWGLYHGDTRLDGTVTIERGGTGATSAEVARKNLDAAATQHQHAMSDISSGVLPLERGGLGTSDPATARETLQITPASIGAAAAEHSHNLNALSGSVSASQLPYKFAMGMATINGDSSITITFSGFSSVPYIVACYCSSSGNWSGDNGAIKIHSRTTSSAQIVVGGNWSSDREICWIAIGV